VTPERLVTGLPFVAAYLPPVGSHHEQGDQAHLVMPESL